MSDINRNYTYYVNTNNPQKKYIVNKSSGLLGGEELIYLLNNDIKNIFYKDDKGMVEYFYRFSNGLKNGNTTIEYFQKKDSLVYELRITYEIRIDDQNRIEKVHNIYHFQNCGGTKGTDILYRYVFDHNHMVSYGIYEFNEPRNLDDNKKVEPEYRLTKGFQLLTE